MKISECQFYRFDVKLKQPIQVDGSKIYRRSGIIIALLDENGSRGLGEAAPLPSLHCESIEDVIKYLPELKKWILSAEKADKNKVVPQFFSPSLRFALDAALISLRAKRRGLTLAAYLNPEAIEKVMINALLLRGEMNYGDKINRIKEAGYKSIKVKIAAGTLDDDAENILRVNDVFEGQAAFRIDANRSLTLQQALIFAEKVKQVPVDYFEEPLKEASQLPAFYQQSGIYYAADESLFQMENEKQLGLKAVVIKPQLYGGWTEIEKLTEQFKEQQIVISDIFSSGVGLNTLIQYAAALGQAQTAMGLDTYQYLKEDIISETLQFKNGAVDVFEAWRKSQTLNYEYLTRLDV